MNRERFLKLYQEIIAINSSSSEKPEEDVSNEKVIDLLISWLPWDSPPPRSLFRAPGANST